jgi:hypothetical protein
MGKYETPETDGLGRARQLIRSTSYFLDHEQLDVRLAALYNSCTSFMRQVCCSQIKALHLLIIDIKK